ncbi:ORF6N domain-containing protein [Thalassovita sp.]|uniref:ORF6N domain-containing protein n=1 Tax=Thalassovita sp. TaxID=1979401 RepID=UPI002881A9B6|nr:ORF6N domain-containing protein [Thalassovita sp.]MDF1804712.1 ORF6N domain-containing protein [Thalassovita sp.]
MSPNTLFDIAGIRARIFTLPGRPPFMLAADLAEVYGTSTRRINEAVKRNPARFPSRYTFLLEEAELTHLRSQNATANPISSKVRYDPRAFTHGGANMLSGVLKSPVADEMAVMINDAFTAMETKALADAKSMVAKLQVEALRKKPIYGFIEMSMRHDQNLDQMWRGANYPRWKLEQAAREMLAMRLIPRLPDGMQPDLFGEV